MRKYRIFGVAVALALAADQASKIVVRQNLQLGERRPVLNGFFDLMHSQNTGAAFSLLHDVSFGWFVLVAFAVIALGIVGVYVRRLPPNATTAAVSLGLIAAGALGNLIDRVALGHVVDFLLVHWHEHYWPVFNVADMELVVGVIGLMLTRTRRDSGSAGDSARPSR